MCLILITYVQPLNLINLCVGIINFIKGKSLNHKVLMTHKKIKIKKKVQLFILR